MSFKGELIMFAQMKAIIFQLYLYTRCLTHPMDGENLFLLASDYIDVYNLILKLTFFTKILKLTITF